MPIKKYIPADASSSGIEIEYVKSTRMFYISGWYDDCAGLQGESISLADFLNGFKITLKDVEKALGKRI